MSGEVKINASIVATITTIAATTIRRGTLAFKGARLRVLDPANDAGKLTVSLKMKLKAAPAINADMRCAGR